MGACYAKQSLLTARAVIWVYGAQHHLEDQPPNDDSLLGSDDIERGSSAAQHARLQQAHG